MLSQEAQNVMQALRANKEATRGQESTPEETVAARQALGERLGAMPSPPDITIERIDEGEVQGEFHHNSRPDKQPDKILLFFFGGGFETGSVVSRRNLCSEVALAARMDAFAVSYRQWPEAMYPAALEDCVRAFHYLESKGYAPHNIRIFGESAGANLTITTTMYLRDHGEALPGKISPFSPLADVGNTLPSRKSREARDPMLWGDVPSRHFAKEDERDCYASPLYGDFHGFPPMLINLGSEEVLYDDSMEIQRLCEKAGVPVTVKVWEGLFHSFCLFPIPETETALAEIGAFLAD